MLFKKYSKKSGFSLTEIVIALFIVAILIMLTVPIVRNQIAKSDDYAYYMAFKSVEKMASQIMLIGDPEEVSITYAEPKTSFKDYIASKFNFSKIAAFFEYLPKRFANSEEYMFKKIFPRTLAATQCGDPYTEPITVYDSSDFDAAWLKYKVCRGDNVQKGTKTVVDEVTGQSKTEKVFYTRDDFVGDLSSLNSSQKQSARNQVCCGYTDSCSTDIDGNVTIASGNDGAIKQGDALKFLYPGSDSTDKVYLAFNYTTVKNNMGLNNTEPNALAFCNHVKSQLGASECPNTPSGEEDIDEYLAKSKYVGYKCIAYMEDEADDNSEPGNDDDDTSGARLYESKTQGQCEIKLVTKSCWDSIDMGSLGNVTNNFTDNDCGASKGWYNMINSAKPNAINCTCRSGYRLSSNNNRVCCRIPSDDNLVSYAYRNGNSYDCKNCDNGFDESKNRCCPDNSVASGGACMCVTGYGWDNETTKNACVRKECPKGYSAETVDGKMICILNPPVIKANRLCKLIEENWNIKNANCNAAGLFDETNPNKSTYSSTVYDALLGAGATSTSSVKSDKVAMSVDSKFGVFKNLQPHITLTNGLKIWILGDKAASIPGLSFSSYNNSSHNYPLNMCYHHKDVKTKAACNAIANAYFCESDNDNNCYSMDEYSTSLIGDARNCCSSPDYSDIMEQATANGQTALYERDYRATAISGFTILVDINGDKGNGTLWEDVYPFFIASNGRVYPGYPIDGDKDVTHASVNVYQGGNSEKFLPTDVYYTDGGVKHVAFSGVSYARAACSTKEISKDSPYCMNLGEKFYGGKWRDSKNVLHELKGTAYLHNPDDNPCTTHKCFISVRRRLSFF